MEELTASDLLHRGNNPGIKLERFSSLFGSRDLEMTSSTRPDNQRFVALILYLLCLQRRTAGTKRLALNAHLSAPCSWLAIAGIDP